MASLFIKKGQCKFSLPALYQLLIVEIFNIPGSVLFVFVLELRQPHLLEYHLKMFVV